jgi:hypothetical protein
MSEWGSGMLLLHVGGIRDPGAHEQQLSANYKLKNTRVNMQPWAMEDKVKPKKKLFLSAKSLTGGSY